MSLLDYDPVFHFIEKLKGGWKGDCRCCGRYAQIYQRRLHSGIAFALAKLYRAGGLTDYIHISDIISNKDTAVSGFDISIARFWGLVIPKNHDDTEEKRTSGKWKLTDLGYSFLMGNIKLQKYILIFDNKFHGFDGDEISIHDCLGTKFNYTELMAA